MTTEFTKEHLMEIEKIFDMYAGENLRVFTQVANSLIQVGIKPDAEITQKIIHELQHSYETYRTISAKAHEGI